MFAYLCRRIVAGCATMFVLITVSFFLMRVIPGGPFSAPEDRNVTPEMIRRVEEKYGLSDPLTKQYARYLKGISRGDLGFSFIQPDLSVNTIIKRGVPATVRLGIIAALLSLLLGVCLGMIAAIWRGTWADRLSMITATLGISIPSFVFSVLLMYLFCGVLKMLPTYGLTTWKHYLLPVAGLSFSSIATITRLTRSSMLEVLRQDYIRTARAKGLPEIKVMITHGLKNAILPVITYAGPMIAGLLTGGFVIERLYSIPGIGREYVTSMNNRDYAVLLGMTIYYGALITIANIAVDIMYALIDPRIKLEN
jgi:oligopeptide transport system permease protein